MMSYRVNRALGYQPWGVTNPWVWANYGQPQRGRGYVSPVVFQTAPPFLRSAHLGAETLPQIETEADAALRIAEEDRQRNQRMESLALIGVVLSGVSIMYSVWQGMSTKKAIRRSRPISANRRKRRRRRR
jgi:hypothetical protein